MSTISVLLAEDHVITREGIRRLLEAEKGITVVGEAGDGEEAVQKAGELKPDVIIMDIAMPKLNGIEATRQIKLNQPPDGRADLERLRRRRIRLRPAQSGGGRLSARRASAATS